MPADSRCHVALVRKADLQRDLGDWFGRAREQLDSALNALQHNVAVHRYADGLFKKQGEMGRAQSSLRCDFNKRNIFGKTIRYIR